MVCSSLAIVPETPRLAHNDVHRLCDAALRAAPTGTVVIDMSCVEEITTSALARLVLLRRQLLRSGRDLRLSGLHARPARLYEITRLQSVLPLC